MSSSPIFCASPGLCGFECHDHGRIVSFFFCTHFKNVVVTIIFIFLWYVPANAFSLLLLHLSSNNYGTTRESHKENLMLEVLVVLRMHLLRRTQPRDTNMRMVIVGISWRHGRVTHQR